MIFHAITLHVDTKAKKTSIIFVYSLLDRIFAKNNIDGND